GCARNNAWASDGALGCRAVQFAVTGGAAAVSACGWRAAQSGAGCVCGLARQPVFGALGVCRPGSVGTGNDGGSGDPHGPRADCDARQSAAQTQCADVSAASPGDPTGSAKSGRQDPDSPAAERAGGGEALAGSV